MDTESKPTMNKVLLTIISALLVAGITGLVALRADVGVQGATIAQHEKRIDNSEADRKQLREALSEIKADNREMKTLLMQIIKQHEDQERNKP